MRNEAAWPELPTGHTLTVTGQCLQNLGQVPLTSGTLQIGGPLRNDGSLTGWGRIDGDAFINMGSVPFANQGTLALASGELVTLPTGAQNSGLVDLHGASALLGGGSLVNTGVVVGQGRINNAFNNTGGRIRAEGGVLVLAGAITGTGQLEPGAGSVSRRTAARCSSSR